MQTLTWHHLGKDNKPICHCNCLHIASWQRCPIHPIEKIGVLSWLGKRSQMLPANVSMGGGVSVGALVFLVCGGSQIRWCGLVYGYADARGIWLPGGWECAAPGHRVRAPCSVWSLFGGALLFCPGPVLWFSTGCLATGVGRIDTHWVFCAACGPLSGSTWWGYGVPVLLIGTPRGRLKCHKK